MTAHARVRPTDAAPPPDDPLARFVATQPIFQADQQVYGYELLFRAGANDAYDGTDGDTATRRVIHNVVNLIGLRNLVGDARPFVNFTENGLTNGDYAPLPPGSVVEVLETVRPTAAVVAACRAAKDRGYVVALDDFVDQPGYGPLLELADILKVDFGAMRTLAQRQACARRARPGAMLLAEKVESPRDMAMARELGYHYAQGYFFCRPTIVQGRELPGHKQRYAVFLAQVNRPELDYNRLEELVKGEVSLSVKLLRYLNTPQFGFASRIASVKQALVLLGQEKLRQWASLAAVTCMAEDKPSELMRMTLVRARFCERCAQVSGRAQWQFDLFLMGMLSTLDAMLDCSMVALIAGMPVPERVKMALMGDENEFARFLSLAQAGEAGDFDALTRHATTLGMNPAQLMDIHLEAQGWARQVLRAA